MKLKIMLNIFCTILVSIALTGCLWQQNAQQKKTVDQTTQQEGTGTVTDEFEHVETGAATQILNPENQLEQELPAIHNTELAHATLYFDYDKFTLSLKAKSNLDEIINIISQHLILKDNKVINVVIKGYTDTRGSAEYNTALGERRAKAVKKYLLSKLTPEQIDNLDALNIASYLNISIVSYGEQDLAEDCASSDSTKTNQEKEECHKKNRRAVLKVTHAS